MICIVGVQVPLLPVNAIMFCFNIMLEFVNFIVYFILYLILFINFIYFYIFVTNFFQKSTYIYILIPLDFLLSLVLLSFILMFYYFSFFNYNIIILTSTSYQDFFYKLFVFWSTQEGSSFFWYILFTFFTLTSIFFINFFIRVKPLFLVLLTNLKSFFFFYFFFYSNCFLVTNFLFFEGYELNSILQSPLMSIHPPMLYIGYLLSIILFVFNIYIYFTLSFKKSYLIFFNLINVLSFFFLWFGILLGSYWAYNELGWGGFWSWDPIENISLLPLIFLIISFHLFLLLNKKKLDNSFFLFFYLQSFYFLSCIFGTFFLRSGLIPSIHNFIIDYSRGIILLSFYIFLLGFVFFFFFHFVGNFAFLTEKTQLKFKNSFKYFLLTFFLFILFVFYFFVFWFTYFSFFIKIYTLVDNVFFDYNFYSSVSFLFFWFVMHLIICWFFLRVKKNFFLWLNVFICFEILCLIFSPNYFFITVFFFIVIYLGFNFFFAKLCLTYSFLVLSIHLIFLLLCFLIIFSNFNSQELLFAVSPGDFLYFAKIFIYFDTYSRVEDFAFSGSTAYVYKFLILDFDFSHILGEVLIDKTFINNSGVLKQKVEVISNIFYDFHFVLSGIDKLFAVELPAVFIKLLIKPFYFFIWLLSFFFFLCIGLLLKIKLNVYFQHHFF